MSTWAPSRRARMERIDAEAEALIRELGDRAYQEARRREHEASSDAIAEDWALVAKAIARKTGSRVGLNLSTQLEMNTFFVLDREPGAPRKARPRPEPEELSRNASRSRVAFPRRSHSGSSSWAREPIPGRRYCAKTRSAPPMSPPRSSPPRSPHGRPRRSPCAFSIARVTRFSAGRKPPADRAHRRRLTPPRRRPRVREPRRSRTRRSVPEAAKTAGSFGSLLR